MGETALVALTTAPFVVLGAVVVWASTASNTVEGVQPNAVIGMRTRATRSSSRAWVAGHRAAAGPVRWTAGAAAALGLLALVLAVVSTDVPAVEHLALVTTSGGLVVLVAGVVVAGVVADRAARRVRDGG